MIEIIDDVKPLFDERLRDTHICVDDKGVYYLTGTSGEDIWDHNDGIKIWKSSDLKNWESLGTVWTFDNDATWQKEPRTHLGKQIRSVWAPEIHYVNDNFYITYSIPPSGTGLLKSVSKKAEGPYVNALAKDEPLTDDIDASLFKDDDGSVYFVYAGGYIAKMNENMDGLVEKPRRMLCDKPDTNPNHHGAKKYSGMDEIGFEGAFLFKHNGKYYLSCADIYYGRYSSIVGVSEYIYGPYTNRHEAIPCGGHNNYFKANDGNWYGTMFGNDMYAPFNEKPAIVKIKFNKDGLIEVTK